MCVTALCAALLVPAAAQGASFTLGVQDDTVLLGGSTQMTAETGLGVMRTIHAKGVRLNVSWSKSLTSDPAATKAPSSPSYDFSALDAGIARIRAAGDAPYITVTGSAPAWATGNKEVGAYKVNATLFSRFSAAVAKHFSGKVAAISIWNEPNWPTTLEPVKTCKTVKKKKVCADARPTLYRDLYAKSYAAIKKVSAKIPVWMGELAPQGRSTTKGAALSPISFVRNMMCVDTKVKKSTCSPLKTDAFAVHPYLLGASPKTKPSNSNDLSMAVLSRASDLLTKLEKIKALRLPNGKTGIPLQLTEFGYLTTSGARGVTVGQQATYVPQAIAMAKKASRVRSLYLYQLIDSDNPDVTWNSGLYYADGKPKPVVAKLAALR